MSHRTLVERFRGARSDPSLALLEGFHPIKHAIRFGAELMEVVCLSAAELARLTASQAPDIAAAFNGQVSEVSAQTFEELRARLPGPTNPTPRQPLLGPIARWGPQRGEVRVERNGSLRGPHLKFLAVRISRDRG